VIVRCLLNSVDLCTPRLKAAHTEATTRASRQAFLHRRVGSMYAWGRALKAVWCVLNSNRGML
jgi:hypothetical protein